MANPGFDRFCNSTPFSISYPYYFETLSLKYPDLNERFNGKKLINVGCGTDPAFDDFVKYMQENYDIPEIVGVDPFNITAKKGRGFETFKEDGLSYLLRQEAGSANIVTNGLDNHILIGRARTSDDVKRAYDYVNKLASEIERVVPKDGAYVSCISDVLEEAARKKFANFEELGNFLGPFIFYK